MKRRQLGIYGLLLFVVGTLMVPIMHKWERYVAHDCGTGNVCHACCAHKHSSDCDTQSHSPNSQSTKDHHDPSTCPICQLAKMPVTIAAVGIPLPQFEPIEITPPIALQQPEFKTPRLLPFSCGPPV